MDIISISDLQIINLCRRYVINKVTLGVESCGALRAIVIDNPFRGKCQVEEKDSPARIDTISRFITSKFLFREIRSYYNYGAHRPVSQGV